MKKNILIPVSIIIGCGLIGLGLYFGLSNSKDNPIAKIIQ